jgi:hypothetical protein
MKGITAQKGATLLLGSGAILAAGVILSSSKGEEQPRIEEPAQSTYERDTRMRPGVARTAPEADDVEAPGDDVKSGIVRESCAFEVGDRASYAIDGKDEAEIEPLGFGFGGKGQPTEVQSSYSGTLNTEVLESSPEGSLMLGKLSRFRTTAVRKDAMLAEPFLFRVSPDCSIGGFAHLESLPIGYARIQQALLHDLSFALPDANVGALYEGRDSLGEIKGEVRRLENGALRKRVTVLEPWYTGMGSLSEVDGYVANVAQGERGWFASVSLDATYSGTGITSRRTLRADLLPEQDAEVFGSASRSQGDYVWADLLPMTIPLDEGGAISGKELRARDALRGEPLDEMLDRMLTRIDAEDVGIQDTWPEMRLYLEARPDMVPVIASKLVKDEIPSRATMGVFIALGNTRNLEAKQALEEIVQDRSIASFDRVRAMFSLVDRPDVGDAFALELAALARPLASSKNKAEHLTARHALLALGMMSGRNPNRDDIKKIAVDAIQLALSEAPNSIIASPAYGALMNIGDPGLLSMIEDIPDHPDYSTREVAAIVMRRMPPSETAEFTRRWLEKEKDWRVKITLYHSLEMQTFAAREMTSREVLELAAADLEQRPGAITRKALVRLLGRAIEEMPEDDPLRQRVQAEFAAMIPFEVENRTGLYRTIAPHLDPATLRLALVGKLTGDNAQGGGDGGGVQQPVGEQPPSIVKATSDSIRSAE